MNEQAYFRELIYERAIDDVRIKSAVTALPRPRVAWRRALAIGLGAAAVLIATVFTIPSTRAEVLSWLRGASSPQDYLTAPDDERAAFSDLHALVSTQDRIHNDFHAIPQSVQGGESAQALSTFLYENCDVSLGDAMFDGEAIYQTIHLNGLSGRYLFDEWTYGLSTAIRLDEQTALTWGEDGEPDSVELDGERIYFQRANGNIRFELADGTTFAGYLDLPFSQTDAFWNSAAARELSQGERSAETERKLDALRQAYLNQNGLLAFAEITPFDWERHVDADGNLTAKVIYTVWVDEYPPSASMPTTDLFKAELGTVTVNMQAWQTIEKRTLSGAAPVEWPDETRVLTKWSCAFGDSGADVLYSLSRQRANMRGVTVAPTQNSGKIDALGIHDLRLRIDVPASWTDAQREALAASLWFDVRIDGSAGNWFPQNMYCSVQPDGSLLWTAHGVEGVPYEMLGSIRSITLTPSLYTVDTFTVAYRDGRTEVLAPAPGETAISGADVVSVNLQDTRVVFPALAITLTVD